MKLRINETIKLNESINCPYQGIFWFINDELICYMDKVNYRDFHDTDLLHVEIWKQIRNQYKVNNKIVPYNYYPRGRVMIMPIFDYNGTFNYYDVTVYLDKCIDTPEIREFIEDRFNLYLSTCKVSYDGQLSVDGSHYVCHNCK